MKIKFFLLGVAVLPWSVSFGSNTATLEDVKEYGIGLSVGSHGNCALEVAKVTCWGIEIERKGLFEAPELTNPRAVSMGDQHVCALDDTGVKCWGSNSVGQTTVPKLINPKTVSAGTLHSCALDEEGAKCWGHNQYGQLKVPLLKNPKSIHAGDAMSCAIDDEGLKCWGHRDVFYGLSKLVEPRFVSNLSTHTCILDQEGVKCGGSNYDGQLDLPRLANPRQVTAGGGFSCALDDEGAKCWGRKMIVYTAQPILKNPVFIGAGSHHICAIDDEGAKCWGIRYKELEFPPHIDFHLVSRFSLLNPNEYFERLSRYFPSHKSEFLKSVGSKAVASTIQSSAESNFLLLSLVKPLIEETSSEVTQNLILSAYEKGMERLNKDFNLNQSVERTPQNLELALDIAQLTLLSVKDKITETSDRADLEVFILELGNLMSSPVFEKKRDSMNRLLQSHQALIETLIQSDKNRSFGLILKKVESFLK